MRSIVVILGLASVLAPVPTLAQRAFVADRLSALEVVRQVLHSSRDEFVHTPGVGGAPGPLIFTRLPGSFDSFDMSVGQRRLFVMTLSGESLCTGSTGYCSARIMLRAGPIGGPPTFTAEAWPRTGANFAFDVASTSTSAWKAPSMTRAIEVFNDLSESIRVEVWVEVTTTTAATTFRLDDWTFLTQISRVESPPAP